MRVQVSSIHFSLSEEFRTYAEERLRERVEKYTDKAVDASITVFKEGHEFQADCSVHLASGLSVQAQGRASTLSAGLDQALDRLEKQLRRHKRRIKDHHSKNAESHRSA